VNEVLVYMEIMVAITVLISFICGVFSYVVIKPLNVAIDHLNTTVHDLEKVITNIDEREHEFDKRLALVEKSLDAANRRIEALVDFYKGGSMKDEMPDNVYRMMKGFMHGDYVSGRQREDLQ